jgi:hypothetical protein
VKITNFKSILIRSLACLLVVNLAACQSGNRSGIPSEKTSEPSVTSMPTSTPTITITPLPTITPTPEYTATPEPTFTPKPAPFFDSFVASLVNGNAWQVVGVYVDGLLALKVVQQPESNPAYVSTQKDVVTYFTMVRELTGNTGLVAHNYLAGLYYFQLQPGQSVILIYGDGSTEEYIVSEMDEYQALSPQSPTSNFVSVATGEALTSSQLFYLVYGGSSRTTMQTCIAQGAEDSGEGYS